MTTRTDSGSGARGALSGILLVLCVLLTIPTVLTTWARADLVDTDKFVATFAPLADEPAVQDMVTDQVMTAIEQNTDLSSIGASLDSLNLPTAATDILKDVAGSAVEKVRALIESSVDRVVSSQAFATTWESVLQQAHTRTIAVLEDEPGSAVTLDEQGTLSLELSTVVEQVKSDLSDRGIPFASAIPDTDRTVPLLTKDSLTTVQLGYDVTVTLGQWLPWIMLALGVLGLLIARSRLSALARTALGCAVMLGVLLLALWIGRRILIGEISDVMSPEAGGAIFDQATTDLRSSSWLLLGLGVLVAVVAWIVGRVVRAPRPA